MISTTQDTQSTPTLSGRVERENKARLELIYEVSKKVGSVPRMTQMLEQVIKMTQQTLGASAASVLLFRDNDHEGFFGGGVWGGGGRVVCGRGGRGGEGGG